MNFYAPLSGWFLWALVACCWLWLGTFGRARSMADELAKLLAEWREIEAKATKGPWLNGSLDAAGQATIRYENVELGTLWHHSVGSIEKEMFANADLITLSRNRFLELLDVVEAADQLMASDGRRGVYHAGRALEAGERLDAALSRLTAAKGGE